MINRYDFGDASRRRWPKLRMPASAPWLVWPDGREDRFVMSGLCCEELTKNAVHVWTAKIDQPQSRLQDMAAVLSDDERFRSSRYLLERDRQRFVVRRAVLRKIVGWYTEIEPKELRFERGEFGKPALAKHLNGISLEFNVSHSGGVALLGFSIARRVGIDVEQDRSLPGWQVIAARYFSAAERAALGIAPPTCAEEIFADFWTRREALTKAVGRGVDLIPKIADLDVTQDEVRLTGGCRCHSHPVTNWTLRSLRPINGYRGAIAAEGRGFKLHSFVWSSEASGVGRCTSAAW